MFDKKFKIVLFLGIAIILIIVFGKRVVNSIGSVDKISTFTEPKSITYYKKSCSYEDSQVCNELGDMYHYGTDIVSVNYDEAVEYYKQACALEDGKGCNNLAYMLNVGKGIKHNNWTAIRLYKKACKYKEMEACYNVGSMYYNGEGVRKNYANAVYFFEKACDERIGAACNNLAYMYESGIYFSRNLQKALRLYIKGCDNFKDATSCNNAAHIYEDTRGNIVTARQYYNKACILENNYGCNKLENVLGSRIYEIKDEKALTEAKNACRRSTKGGNMCYRVGLYYEKEKEIEKARNYFEEACSRQQSQSCKHLGDLYR